MTKQEGREFENLRKRSHENGSLKFYREVKMYTNKHFIIDFDYKIPHINIYAHSHIYIYLCIRYV